ncbi:sphingolipid C9-methyltransferase-like protein [Neoconidiobolus thromboides FSU 785]|nr:sphingolipid C9-methyltransferase-like protein [Neoconidiobolus thromboides FSU 785]
MNLVAKKLRLKEGETLLDLGCGWGTFVCHAAKHFGVKATGVTLAKEQFQFANDRAAKYGVSESAKFICSDARDIERKKYNKISCLEMAEHIGVLNFNAFMLQIREMLEDDGLFYMQVAGLRSTWQYEDFVWGLFMAKYVFPGADASTPLNWFIGQLEKAGFEVLNVDTIGVHYSATLQRWYELWISNKEAILTKYGIKWFRKWEVFLAWSTLIARQGSSTCFQILAHKNINRFNRFQLIDNKRLLP